MSLPKSLYSFLTPLRCRAVSVLVVVAGFAISTGLFAQEAAQATQKIIETDKGGWETLVPWWVGYIFGVVGFIFGPGAYWKWRERADKKRAEQAAEQNAKEESQTALGSLLKLLGLAKAPVPAEMAALQAHFNARLNAFRQKYPALPARPLRTGYRIVALVSGKGGVGKSSIGLGLLEYFVAKGNETVLVDFDMPNRGLTSLLGNRVAETNPVVTVLEKLADFMTNLRNPEQQNGPGAAGGDIGNANAAVPNVGPQINPNNLAWVGMQRTDGITPQAIDLADPAKLLLTIHANNAHFLPSIPPSAKFLSSPVFTATEIEVDAFLHDMAARMPVGVNTLIVDCHGAHDLFMVGAIQAATDLVVVTTPEAGSFEGTYDLVSYAMSLAPGKRPLTTTLLVNNVASWQDKAAEHLTMFYEGQHIEEVPDDNRIKPDKVLLIRSDDGVRKFMGNYELGAVSKTALWKPVCEIGKFILEARSRAVPAAGV